MFCFLRNENFYKYCIIFEFVRKLHLNKTHICKKYTELMLLNSFSSEVPFFYLPKISFKFNNSSKI